VGSRALRSIRSRSDVPQPRLAAQGPSIRRTLSLPPSSPTVVAEGRTRGSELFLGFIDHRPGNRMIDNIVWLALCKGNFRTGKAVKMNGALGYRLLIDNPALFSPSIESSITGVIFKVRPSSSRARRAKSGFSVSNCST